MTVKRAVRVPHLRLAERGYAVADRLDTGHRRAAAREGAQQQPDRERLCRGRDRGRRYDGLGMPARLHRLPRAPRQHEAETRDEKIGRYRPDESRFARAPQVQHGDRKQDYEADPKRVGMQGRNRGGECADARRDADRDVQHVIQHQRRRREQTRARAEILFGDGVGAAARGIGGDGLPVPEIEDGEQEQDHPGDRTDRSEAGGARAREYGERRFRPVGRGAETVQAHGRNAFEDSELGIAGLAICKRPADQELGQECGHGAVVRLGPAGNARGSGRSR